MTDGDKQQRQDEYSGRSAMQLCREILKLALVLLWRILLWCIKKFLKGLLWLIQAIETGLKKLNVWWHDNNTQEKVAKTKAWLYKAMRTLGRWCVIAGKSIVKWTGIGAVMAWRGLKKAARATLRGIVIAIKAIVRGIIHLRPTIKKILRLTVRGVKATWAWMKRCRKGMKLFYIRRKRAYRRFRSNGGVKGMMVDTSRSIRNGIQMFMEEDQEEAAPDAVTEDDIMAEEFEEKANEGIKSIKLGKSFMDKAKDFMDRK